MNTNNLFTLFSKWTIQVNLKRWDKNQFIYKNIDLIEVSKLKGWTTTTKKESSIILNLQIYFSQNICKQSKKNLADSKFLKSRNVEF